MTIDKYNLQLSKFSTELDGEIKEELRTLITTEVDVYATEFRDNGDGTHNKVYKCKVVGSTIVKQGKEKPILGKSKRSASQQVRWAIDDYKTGEDFYQLFMGKLKNNIADVWETLKDK